MTRKDIEKNSICLVRGRFGKPDLNRISLDGQTYMVKDVRKRNFFLRLTLGLWLIHKEWKIYCQLKGLKGIPQPMERIDLFAFAMEYIPGKAVGRDEMLLPPFFLELERVLRDVHSRGVVHLDLRHKGNILVSDEGKPFLIDFNSSFSFKDGGIAHRFLFPLLRWVDYGGLLKLKERASPSSMTSDETKFLKRFNRLRKLWIFN
jgi:serine/threonine protein kinase